MGLDIFHDFFRLHGQIIHLDEPARAASSTRVATQEFDAARLRPCTLKSCAAESAVGIIGRVRQ